MEIKYFKSYFRKKMKIQMDNKHKLMLDIISDHANAN